MTNLCLRLNPNPLVAGAIPGYADMGGWKGGQAEYVMIPYADFNLLVLPRSPTILQEHIQDFGMLADILPTGCNGAVQAGVTLGSTVYIAGCGPVGLCAAASSFALGASKVVVADVNPDRLPLAAAIGCYTLDLSNAKLVKGFIEQDGYKILETLKQIMGDDLEGIDCAIDCVGYEASEAGDTYQHGKNEPEQALNTCLCVARAGGRVSFPGLFLPVDPKGPDMSHKRGEARLKVGQAFAKSINLLGGQCPVKQYNRELMRLILNKRLPKLTNLLNIQVVELTGAPKAYEIFNGGKPVKYLIDPHGMLKQILKGEWVNEFEDVRGKDPLRSRQEEAERKASEGGVSNTESKMFG
jgi:glutathione-independent formaldehyde dehydrogenase